MLAHKGTQTVTTERLILRRFTVEDAVAMFDNWATDEKTVKYLLWEPHSSPDATRELLADWVKGYENPECYNWLIEYEGKPIGSIGFHNISDRNHNCELGYCIGSVWWNKGIVTEAAKALIDYMFTETGMHKICAKHDTENIASGRVMQKCGMKHEGVLREHSCRRDGTYGDMACYGILRDGWRTQKEIDEYISLPCFFDGFIDHPCLSDGEIELACTAKKPAIPEKNYVPAYGFDICKGGQRIGEINLRIGYTAGLYYGGNIGYGIDEAWRGHGYAAKACRLLAPVIKAHGMKKVVITNEKDNIASKRTCEKLGAKFIRIAALPEWTELYRDGQRHVNIFEWVV
jgi:ribosomal-protein-alanine N-acetyltransferase